MRTYANLYQRLCSYDNLLLAYRKARKGKAQKDYVIDFEPDLERNLLLLKGELERLEYSPEPIATFILRDPKTRRIGASSFRDRVVHHALCNVIGPIFESRFIYDSFANQQGKGTHRAILRFEEFTRRVSRNAGRARSGQQKLLGSGKSYGYVLKADIKHYFDTVDQGILMQIISKRIKDARVIWLVGVILRNHRCDAPGKGMPIGNLTSQFFANVYLDELDQFVKHRLGVRYYIRYVDDFVILHRDRKALQLLRGEIQHFLVSDLRIELHPDKTRVVPLDRGITFLGFRVFPLYRLLKKSNARRIWRRMDRLKRIYAAGEMSAEQVSRSIEGWLGYARFADTYNLRRRVESRYEELFAGKVRVGFPRSMPASLGHRKPL
ncbi:MAG: group II intron reverse transcriptase domain-containing protein [Candidatus Micrarchaeota archaeon]|nr:group II intron reverse transcriptase domain-containing protein [Candidatus Micrarchaeota archaeon]